MYIFAGMNYTSAMEVPVPVRKWLIRRWNEQKEKENGASKKDPNQALTQSEKNKALRDAAKLSGGSPPVSSPSR